MTMARVQVEVRERMEELLEEKRRRVLVACDRASQSLHWLAFASCLRMAHATGDMPSNFIPQTLKKMDGTILDSTKSICDSLEEGSEVLVECSSGPNSFICDLEARTVHSVPFEVDCKTLTSDYGVIGIELTSDKACNILDLIEWSLYNIEDVTCAKGVLSPHLGLLQALLIWYSCQGKELEDKDLGVLNLSQFVQLFQETVKAGISVDTLERIFKELLEANGRKGFYQLTPLEFIPSIFFVASGVSPRNIQAGVGKDIIFKAKSLIDDCLVPAWNSQSKPMLQVVQTTSRDECLKWHILERNWNLRIVGMLVIYALQNCKMEANELAQLPLDLRFGVHELQEFLVGAAFFCHNEAMSPLKISDKAYLQDYLKKVFTKAGVARPLYTTYDEKKDYLRSLLIRRSDETRAPT